LNFAVDDPKLTTAICKRCAKLRLDPATPLPSPRPDPYLRNDKYLAAELTLAELLATDFPRLFSIIRIRKKEEPAIAYRPGTLPPFFLDLAEAKEIG
jgi:hypothetical protein